MEKERKLKLLKYLYPSEQIRQFLCDDLYLEFMDIIPKNLCISSNNKTNIMRKENFNKVVYIITIFFKNNPKYQQKILELFNKSFDYLTYDIIAGYVFNLSNTIPRYIGIDIFRDKKSICYTPVSVIDLLE